MPIQNPPITDDQNLNFILLEIISKVNSLEQSNLKLIEDIKSSSDFASFKAKVE
jgi:hypothetical protein